MFKTKTMQKYISSLLIFVVAISSCTTAEIPLEEVTPITETVKYNPDVQNVIFNNCLNCHGAQNPSAGLSLVNYNQVRASAENGNLISRMNDANNPMPPSGLLSSQTLAVMDKWVTDGYLEN